MSGYVRSTKFEGTFDGKPVRASLKPIKFGDAMRIYDMLPKKKGDPINDTALMEEFGKLLPQYIESLELAAEDGSAVTAEEVCSVMYFSPLMMEMGMKWVEAGTPPNPKKPGVRSGS